MPQALYPSPFTNRIGKPYAPVARNGFDTGLDSTTMPTAGGALPLTGYHHDHNHEVGPETRLAHLGQGLLLGGAVVALGRLEERHVAALNTLKRSNIEVSSLPKWLHPKVESSSLLNLNPSTVLKALGLAGSAGLINKGLGLHLHPAFMALELGGMFHSLIPGSTGMKVAHFATMAPLLAGSAYIANKIHEKTDETVEASPDLSPTDKALTKGLIGLGASAGVAVGAMAAFPRINMRLTELQLGGKQGWYINTATAVDSLVSGGREAFKALRKQSNDVGETSIVKAFQQGLKLPAYAEEDSPIKGLKSGFNYYRQHVPTFSSTQTLSKSLYQQARSLRFTHTAKTFLNTTFDGLGYVAQTGIAKPYQGHYQAEMDHVASGYFTRYLAGLDQALQHPEHSRFKQAFTAKQAALVAQQHPEHLATKFAARDVVQTQGNAMPADVLKHFERIANHEDGDLFKTSLYSHEMMALLHKHYGSLLPDGLKSRVHGALHGLIDAHPNQKNLLKKGQRLEQSFAGIDEAVKATEPLYAHFNLNPNDKGSLQQYLIQKGWNPEDAEAFGYWASRYASTATHVQGHNPRRTTAWNLNPAGVGGVLCANGCCAGSVFCLNEAVALLSSTGAAVAHHLGGHRKDKKDDAERRNIGLPPVHVSPKLTS